MLRILFALLTFAMPASAEVTVFAAASLKSVLDEVHAAAPLEVTASFAGSAALARQIDQGAPADIFISASTEWSNWVVDSLSLTSKSTADIARNELVVVAPKGSKSININNLPDLIGAGRLAMGHSRAVPAGVYGKEALSSLGLWDEIAPQVVQTEHVRAALRLVALGEVPFGITYATDAQDEARVDVVYRFPAKTHAPIIYRLVDISASPQAQAYTAYLTSESARAIFAAQGFLQAFPE